MSERKFEVGDLVKGISWMYGITNERMTLAEVLEVDDVFNSMRIKILEHKFEKNIGKKFWVANSTKHFKLVEKKQDSKIVIFINGRDVIAKNTETGKTAKATCHKDDEFDFAIGAKLALERLMPTKEVTETTRLERFEEGKTYVFDKECYLKSGGSEFCTWWQNCVGKTVKVTKDTLLGEIDNFGIHPWWCKEVEPVIEEFPDGCTVELLEDYFSVPKGARGVVVKNNSNLDYIVDFKIKYDETHRCANILQERTGLYVYPDIMKKVD